MLPVAKFRQYSLCRCGQTATYNSFVVCLCVVVHTALEEGIGHAHVEVSASFAAGRSSPLPCGWNSSCRRVCCWARWFIGWKVLCGSLATAFIAVPCGAALGAAVSVSRSEGRDPDDLSAQGLLDGWLSSSCLMVTFRLFNVGVKEVADWRGCCSVKSCGAHAWVWSWPNINQRRKQSSLSEYGS